VQGQTSSTTGSASMPSKRKHCDKRFARHFPASGLSEEGPSRVKIGPDNLGYRGCR
jgi:hypothetical protein